MQVEDNYYEYNYLIPVFLISQSNKEFSFFFNLKFSILIEQGRVRECSQKNQRSEFETHFAMGNWTSSRRVERRRQRHYRRIIRQRENSNSHFYQHFGLGCQLASSSCRHQGWEIFKLKFKLKGNGVLRRKDEEICWFPDYGRVADDGKSGKTSIWHTWKSCHHGTVFKLNSSWMILSSWNDSSFSI